MKSKVFLFPLLNSITLRKVALPYHIFEPRYQQMINDAFEQEALVTVMPPLDGIFKGRACYAGVPQLLNRHADGRMEIAIMGEVRCRLGDFVATDNPYLVSEYEEEEEDGEVSSKSEFARECIYDGLVTWSEQKLADREQFRTFRHVLDDTESLLSYGTLFLVEDMEERLKVVESRKWDKKAELILKALGPKEVSLGPYLPPLRW